MMTVMEPVATDAEETAAPQRHGAALRVTIREIREYAYRALIASGASPGEAASAAGQVLHAELHHGEGLSGLAADLSRGSWPREGLSCTRRRGEVSILEVDCGSRSGALRIGGPIVDLVAGEVGPAAALTSAEIRLSALVDDPMIAAAAAADTTLTAFQQTPRGHFLVRQATPQGELGEGRTVQAPSVSGMETFGSAWTLVLLAGAVDDTTRAHLTWSTPGQRAERRRGAARTGVQVDEVTWSVVAAHAKRFLVPEDAS